MTSRARVLFVDDEPHLLAGLRRSLHTRGVGWQISFAASGAEALDLMTAEPCDAVISDMRMPGMDGAQLLDRIRRAHPGTARFVLSGEADRDAVLASASVAALVNSSSRCRLAMPSKCQLAMREQPPRHIWLRLAEAAIQRRPKKWRHCLPEPRSLSVLHGRATLKGI